MGSTPILATKKAPQRGLFAFMKFVVYVLYSARFKKHYTGFSSDIAERITSHNEYGKDWTARYRPWKLIHTKEFETKAEAMAYEKWLKSGVGRDFIKSLLH